MELTLSVLLILMIIAAITAIEIKDLLSSVVSIGAVGVILSLVFLVLQAPDLAIVQLVVEILSLVVLIRATISRDESVYSGKEFVPRMVGLFGGIIVIYFIIVALKQLPLFGFPKYNLAGYYVKNALKETGVTNIVSAIILNYRGYDTLGEATVLFCAIIGVTAIMRKVGRKK